MPKQLRKCLKLSGDQDSYLFHAFSVHTDIAVAYAGSRTKVNCLRGFIEEKLHVIDKSEQRAGELVVEIGLVFIDELAPRQCCEHRFQRLLRFRARFLVLERCDNVVFIGRLRRDAIRLIRTCTQSSFGRHITFLQWQCIVCLPYSKEVRYPCSRNCSMLAKKTSKNQLTLPKN